MGAEIALSTIQPEVWTICCYLRLSTCLDVHFSRTKGEKTWPNRLFIIVNNQVRLKSFGVKDFICNLERVKKDHRVTLYFHFGHTNRGSYVSITCTNFSKCKFCIVVISVVFGAYDERLEYIDSAKSNGAKCICFIVKLCISLVNGHLFLKHQLPRLTQAFWFDRQGTLSAKGAKKSYRDYAEDLLARSEVANDATSDADVL